MATGKAVWAAAALAVAWVAAAPGEVALKGVSMGDHIDKARAQLEARVPPGVSISAVMPAEGEGKLQFTLNDGAGWVVSDDHERVKWIWLSPALACELFDLEPMTDAELAGLLGAAWEIPPEAWGASWVEGPWGAGANCLQATTGDCTVTVGPGGGVMVRRTSPGDIRKILK
jgi:hypothetical protein